MGETQAKTAKEGGVTMNVLIRITCRRMISTVTIGLVVLTLAQCGAPQGVPSKQLTVGESTKLSTQVAVALTAKAYIDLNNAARAKDTIGYSNVFLRGDAIVADAGTTVRVIEIGLTSTKVRILDGPHAGRAGWVSYELISR